MVNLRKLRNTLLEVTQSYLAELNINETKSTSTDFKTRHEQYMYDLENPKNKISQTRKRFHRYILTLAEKVDYFKEKRCDDQSQEKLISAFTDLETLLNTPQSEKIPCKWGNEEHMLYGLCNGWTSKSSLCRSGKALQQAFDDTDLSKLGVKKRLKEIFILHNSRIQKSLSTQIINDQDVEIEKLKKENSELQSLKSELASKLLKVSGENVQLKEDITTLLKELESAKKNYCKKSPRLSNQPNFMAVIKGGSSQNQMNQKHTNNGSNDSISLNISSNL